MVSFKRAFLDELELLIQWRRDVRRFETRPVPKQLLLDLLDLAYCAPSVGLSQPWRFVWVRDPGRRQQVIDSFERCNADALEDFDGALAERYASLKLEGLREGGSGADRIVGAIRPGVRRGEAAYAAMT